ncbi:flagellar hook-basal body protein [Tumebacillus sp. DT12]|uniref:Flagellar hook-basal body protein n=1 Tax=Tumebacillus lacus TaxID=2995335 RepID=A0ABT3X460_9BACL|nr:flagellar hook-basal body protein [Tumebacillus lacus]MCX7569524.1 flagellar hook-basal body protein [Tumebacillus lacus]
MRALWTSASGLNAQQIKLDTVANNLANVNTTGYKSQDVNFKDLLYAQFVQKPDVGNLTNRLTEPGLRIGHGVRVTGLAQSMAQGSLQQTTQLLDVALEGNGFFKVESDSNNTYTRDGSFKVGILNDEPFLVDASGRRLLDADNRPISLAGYDIETLTVAPNGTLNAVQTGQGTREDIAVLQIAVIDHPDANLQPAGGNYLELNAGVPAGTVRNQNNYAAGDQPAKARQGYLEGSNVNMAAQMTEMIVAQRAYSMNAKMVQTADEMMGLANNLRN